MERRAPARDSLDPVQDRDVAVHEIVDDHERVAGLGEGDRGMAADEARAACYKDVSMSSFHSIGDQSVGGQVLQVLQFSVLVWMGKNREDS